MADAAENSVPPKPAARPAGPPPMWMAAGGKTPVGRNMALVFGALLIVLVFGGLVGILLLPEPPAAAYLVSLPLPLYDDPALPPVPFAEDDTKRLVTCFPGNAENAYNVQEVLEGKLKAIGGGKLRADWGDDERRTLENGRPFVFHAVGHAAAVGDTIYLLPIKAAAADPRAAGVPLDHLLKAMADCPTPKKLLLLDLGHPRTNAFQGVLFDDVTPKLHDWLARKRAELPCPVLVSCSPEQTSSVIPQVGASAFAFYAAEGLRGAADGYAGADPDKRVKVRELAEFVKLRVARWARQNRDLPQVPRLFEPPDFPDYDLMLDVPPPVTEDADPPRKLDFAKAGTADGWARVAALSPDALRRAGPQVAQWATAAVRAEQIYAAGDAKSATAATQANDWLAEIARAARPPESPGYRTLAGVALPPPGGTPPTDAAAAALTALRAYALAAVPEKGTKADEKDVAVRRTEFQVIADKLPEGAAAKVVWDWLMREFPQPQRGHVVFAANTVARSSAAAGDPPFAEAAGLKWVAALDSGTFDNTAGRRAASQALRAEAQAAAALRPGAEDFTWVAAALKAADDKKRAAEQRLRKAEGSAEMRAAEEDFAAVTELFRDVEERRTALAAARAAADDAVRVCAATAWAAAEHNWPPAGEWQELKTRGAKLADAVYRRPPADWTAADLAAKTKAAAEATAAILKQFDAAAVKALADKAGAAQAGELRVYFAAIETGLLTGADRGKVWDAAGQIAERLHAATRTDGDLNENASRAKTKAPALPAAPADGRTRRADVSVGLLELGGHPDAASLRAEANGLVGAGDEKWAAFAARLRTAWAAEARAKWIDKLTEDAAWDAVDRFARAYPIGAAPGTPDKPGVANWRVAAAKRREDDDAAFNTWLDAHRQMR